MSLTLEVKVGNEDAPIWLDRDQFRVVKRSNQSVLLTDGRTAFSILVGKRRETWLRHHGFDPETTYEG